MIEWVATSEGGCWFRVLILLTTRQNRILSLEGGELLFNAHNFVNKLLQNNQSWCHVWLLVIIMAAWTRGLFSVVESISQDHPFSALKFVTFVNYTNYDIFAMLRSHHRLHRLQPLLILSIWILNLTAATLFYWNSIVNQTLGFNDSQFPSRYHTQMKTPFRVFFIQSI